MKKIKYIVLLSLAVLMLWSVTGNAAQDIFKSPDLISANDFARVMQSSTIEYINDSNDVLMNHCKSKIIFTTVPTTGEESIDTYAQRLYKAWSVAYIGDSSSVFVLLATDDMQYWPIVGSHIQSAMTPDIVNNILLTYMEPDFEKRNFDTAVRKTYDAFYNWYKSTYNSNYDTSQADPDGDITANRSGNKVLGIIWTIFKIILLLAIIILVLYVYIRRQLRLRQIARRKRIRKATIEKYRSEPKEQYSFSYSYANDDDND